MDTPQDLSAIGWPLRTARLSIRPATIGDVAATYAIRRIPEVSHWITTAATDPDAYRAHFCAPDRLAKTLVLEHGATGGEVVGDLMLAVDDAWAQSEVRETATGTVVELGWVLAPAWSGQGLATEAVGEVLRACFEELGVRRVVANCFADNTASWRLMERLGMRREVRTVKESLHRSGAWLDGLGYALLAEEWRASARGRVP